MKYLQFAILVATAAFVLNSCRCDDVEKPYYDFDDISLHYNNGYDYEEDLALSIYWSEENIVFLAQQEPFYLLSRAYATQPCPKDGDFGRKYPLIDIDVTSDQDFDGGHPAGSSLKAFFAFRDYDYESGDYYFKKLNTLALSSDYNQIYGVHLEAVPPLNSTHVFTLMLVKENLDTIWAQTDPITF